MPKRRSKLTEKNLVKRPLRSGDYIDIRISASEINLARITAMMLYAADPIVREEYVIQDDTPMPWEEGGAEAIQAFNEQKFADEAIDWETVRTSIVKLMEQYIKLHKAEGMMKVLRSFNVERLRDVPREHLLGLHDGLDASLNGVSKQGTKAEDVPWHE